MSAVDVVDTYLSDLRGGARRLGHAEWGLRVEPDAAAGAPLDVGVRIADGLVRAQAFAVPAQPGIDPWLFLHWNRQTRLARFGCTRSGDVWVHADLPVAGLDEPAVDRLLGLVVQGAIRAREYAAAVAAGAGVAGTQAAEGTRAPGEAAEAPAAGGTKQAAAGEAASSTDSPRAPVAMPPAGD